MNWSILETDAATAIPNAEKISDVKKQNSGTSSMPGAGSSPNANDTISGKHPYTDARSPIHSISAVTSSSTSTGAARIAS